MRRWCFYPPEVRAALEAWDKERRKRRGPTVGEEIERLTRDFRALRESIQRSYRGIDEIAHSLRNDHGEWPKGSFTATGPPLSEAPGPYNSMPGLRGVAFFPDGRVDMEWEPVPGCDSYAVRWSNPYRGPWQRLDGTCFFGVNPNHRRARRRAPKRRR